MKEKKKEEITGKSERADEAHIKNRPPLSTRAYSCLLSFDDEGRSDHQVTHFEMRDSVLTPLL